MGTSVWQMVRERLDPMQQKPQLRPDVVVRELESARHGPHYIIKSPRAGTYLRLSPREHFSLGLMDGNRTIKEIVLEYFYQYGSLAFNRVILFVKLLHEHSFLVSVPIPTYVLLRERLGASRGWKAAIKRVLDFLLGSEIAFGGIDAFVTRVYKAVGRLLLTGPVLTLFGVVAAAGLVAFMLAEPVNRLGFSDLLTSSAGVVTAIVAILFFGLIIFSHEMAHALTCKSFGREVRRGGFALYFGFPAFFVDTTDIWLENRWRRIAVSMAGSISDLVVAGAFSLLALILPPGPAAVSLLLAGLAYTLVVVNLFPLLALDGYYVLVDLLEMPLLRARSFAFVRESLPKKVWRRERFSAEEVILTTYGVLAGAYTAFFATKAFRFLEVQVSGLITAVVSTENWLLVPIAVLLVTVVGLPMVLRALGLATHAAQTVGHGVRVLAGVAEQTHLRTRAALLAGIPVLADLPSAQLQAIAAAMRPRRHRAGRTIIRQGERGDRFFLIVRGTAEVVQATVQVGPDGEAVDVSTKVATLGGGDYFGELALLNQAPRAATVWALSDLDCLELSADDFARLVSPTWQLKERMARAVKLRDVIAGMDLFKELGPSERDLLLTKLQDESFEAGEVILRQGEVGERFYVIREGRVEVLRAEPGEDPRRVAELGPGEFFGEIALVLSASRTATVRALTPVGAWSLSRQDFDDVLGHYLQMSPVFEATGRRRLSALEDARSAVV